MVSTVFKFYMKYPDFSWLKEDVEISRRKFAAVTILMVCTLAWFLLLQIYFSSIISNVTGENYWVYIDLVLFYGFGAFSAIIGSMISEKISRRKLIGFWIMLATITTASLAFFQGTIISVLCSISLGFSLGLGFPSSESFLADHTTVKDRGRVSGIIIFGALVVMFLAMIVITFLSFDLTFIIFFLAVLRMTSFLALILDSSEREIGKQKPWLSILTYREFAFYILPWMMFNIATGLRGWWSFPDLPEYESVIMMGGILFLVCTAFFGLISGFVADYFGRKYPIISGMILMGVSFAVLGVAVSPEILIIYDIISGIAWGFLLTIYLAIPGDLAFPLSKEKFYALGMVIPFILFLFFSAVPEFYQISISPSELSPFLSMIIFLSIIPILRAKETLPKRKLEERRMKKYVDKVGKLVQESKNSK
jgi:MFS family permease